MGDYRCTVAWDSMRPGELQAVGTEDEPILFTKEASAPGWKGIIFETSPRVSALVHCKVKNANDSGIQIENCFPILDNCHIGLNTSDSNGGGMKITLDAAFGDLVLTDCTISDNKSTSHGGGIYAIVSTASLTFKDCQINSNSTRKDNDKRSCCGGGVYVKAHRVVCLFTGGL